MGTLLLPDEGPCHLSELDNWLQSIEPIMNADEKSLPQVFIKNPLVSERHVTETMIVCGDCSGEEKLPRKTFLTAAGRCDNCGGHSYVLASILLQRRFAL